METTTKIGKVEKVGKKMSKNEKCMCWIKHHDKCNNVDFAKEVDAWKYIKNPPKIQFNGETIKGEKDNDEQKKDTTKSMEEIGVFYMERKDIVEVLVSQV